MSVAIKNTESYINGINKKQFETSLHEISDQIRIMDQKLIMKTEHEINTRYENQLYNISKVKKSINHLKF